MELKHILENGKVLLSGTFGYGFRECPFIFIYFIFFPKKTPSISYKNLHMRVLYINPCRDVIVPSYVDAH